MVILEEIERVCQENNIAYCLAYGTCLGAVRHKGFIPWDDDIDLFMPVDDFIRFCNNSHAFKHPFFLQTKETDPEYGLMIARVRDSRTTLIEEAEKDRDINHGVFVDIYPLFNCPQGGWKFTANHVVSMIHRLFRYDRAPHNRGKLLEIGAEVLLRVTPGSLKKKIEQKSFNMIAGYPFSGYVSSHYGNDSRVVYRYDWFFPPKKVRFEDIDTFIPANSDKFLLGRYGDYMKLPPKEEQVFHHDFYKLDLDNSYKDYYGRYYCTNK